VYVLNKRHMLKGSGRKSHRLVSDTPMHWYTYFILNRFSIKCAVACPISQQGTLLTDTAHI
jgi:hypothetical protein